MSYSRRQFLSTALAAPMLAAPALLRAASAQVVIVGGGFGGPAGSLQ